MNLQPCYMIRSCLFIDPRESWSIVKFNVHCCLLLYFQKYILIANKAATYSYTFLWQIDSFSVQWTHAEWRVPAVPHPFRQALEKMFIFGKVLHISFVKFKFWSYQVVLQWIHCLICKAPHIFCDFILTSQFNESLTYVFGKAAWHIPNTLAISLTFTFFVEIIRLINYTFSCLCWFDLTVTSFEFKTKLKASIFWEGQNTDFSICTWKPKLVNWFSTHVHVCIVQKNPQQWKKL